MCVYHEYLCKFFRDENNFGNASEIKKFGFKDSYNIINLNSENFLCLTFKTLKNKFVSSHQLSMK